MSKDKADQVVSGIAALLRPYPLHEQIGALERILGHLRATQEASLSTPTHTVLDVTYRSLDDAMRDEESRR